MLPLLPSHVGAVGVLKFEDTFGNRWKLSAAASRMFSLAVTPRVWLDHVSSANHNTSVAACRRFKRPNQKKSKYPYETSLYLQPAAFDAKNEVSTTGTVWHLHIWLACQQKLLEKTFFKKKTGTQVRQC